MERAECSIRILLLTTVGFPALTQKSCEVDSGGRLSCEFKILSLVTDRKASSSASPSVVCIIAVTSTKSNAMLRLSMGVDPLALPRRYTIPLAQFSKTASLLQLAVALKNECNRLLHGNRKCDCLNTLKVAIAIPSTACRSVDDD